jgi:hypothetical protein
MVIESVSPSLMLAAGELVRLPAGAYATIICARGALWVTRDGDPQDIVLSRGDTLDIRGGPLTLVQAFEPSLLQVREARAHVAAGAGAPEALGQRRSAADGVASGGLGALITSVISRPQAAWRSATGACEA